MTRLGVIPALVLALAGSAEARSSGGHYHSVFTAHPYDRSSTRRRGDDERDVVTRRHYVNVSGHWVRSPTRTLSGRRPPGATAHCADGSWSFSEYARGTCSHHGGIG